MSYRAYLLDIEGTTTPVDFVFKTLFPYARESMASFVGSASLADEATWLSEEYEGDTDAPEWPGRPSPAAMAPYLLWLMDRDRKSRGLKAIQGKIWEEGYRTGRLLAEVYPDVEPAMRRWVSRGSTVNIYSSGSVLAQQLLFGHLPGGSLMPLIHSYFDTEVGAKREASSYRTIALRLSVEPRDVLFLSDIFEEVQAAREAGMDAIQVLRDGQEGKAHKTIRSFDEIA